MALYYLTLTQHGAAALAAAQAGQPFAFADLVLGDANGQPYLPDSAISRTALVHECAAVPVQSVTVVGDQVHVQTVIPASIGGFAIHELGLTDAAGQLLYIGNWHGGYKPALTEGAAGELELTLILDTSGLPQVVIELDPTSVLATRQWALDHFVLQTVYDAHITQNALEHADLQDQIDAETAARSAAVQDLTTQLTNESILRGQADALEQQARIAGDQHLLSQLNAITPASIEQPESITTGLVTTHPVVLNTISWTGRRAICMQARVSQAQVSGGTYVGDGDGVGELSLTLDDGTSVQTKTVNLSFGEAHNGTELTYIRALDPEKTYTLTLSIATVVLTSIHSTIYGYTQ